MQTSKIRKNTKVRPQRAPDARSSCGDMRIYLEVEVHVNPAHGLRDGGYLRLKILTCMLPKL